MTDERLAQITHPGPLEAELLSEVRRLRAENGFLRQKIGDEEQKRLLLSADYYELLWENRKLKR